MFQIYDQNGTFIESVPEYPEPKPQEPLHKRYSILDWIAAALGYGELWNDAERAGIVKKGQGR